MIRSSGAQQGKSSLAIWTMDESPTQVKSWRYISKVGGSIISYFSVYMIYLFSFWPWTQKTKRDQVTNYHYFLDSIFAQANSSIAIFISTIWLQYPIWYTARSFCWLIFNCLKNCSRANVEFFSYDVKWNVFSSHDFGFQNIFQCQFVNWIKPGNSANSAKVTRLIQSFIFRYCFPNFSHRSMLTQNV